MKLLLLDDDESILLTLGALLEDEGYEVAEARTLAQARLALGAGRFDAVLLDLHVGSDAGTDLLPDIARHCPAARVVLLSGAPVLELPAGVHGAVLKGERLDALLPLLSSSGARLDP